MKKIILALCTIVYLGIASKAQAEPVNRWWSGWGMGVSEYGWSGSDGSKIYIACDDAGEVDLSVAIRGKNPKPNSDVIFKINGQKVSFRTDSYGQIEMISHVSINSLFFLYDELRSGKSMILQFNGLSKTFSLAGSAKGLRPALCE